MAALEIRVKEKTEVMNHSMNNWCRYLVVFWLLAFNVCISVPFLPGKLFLMRDCLCEGERLQNSIELGTHALYSC